MTIESLTQLAQELTDYIEDVHTQYGSLEEGNPAWCDGFFGKDSLDIINNHISDGSEDEEGVLWDLYETTKNFIDKGLILNTRESAEVEVDAVLENIMPDWLAAIASKNSDVASKIMGDLEEYKELNKSEQVLAEKTSRKIMEWELSGMADTAPAVPAVPAAPAPQSSSELHQTLLKRVIPHFTLKLR